MAMTFELILIWYPEEWDWGNFFKSLLKLITLIRFGYDKEIQRNMIKYHSRMN